MNRYGRMALEHHQRHRPTGSASIPEPATFFAAAGEQIAAEVTRLRDELLGPPQEGEDPEAFRLRSYQALATAEELVLADHHLLQPDPNEEPDMAGDWNDDPDLALRYQLLAEINQTIHTSP